MSQLAIFTIHQNIAADKPKESNIELFPSTTLMS